MRAMAWNESLIVLCLWLLCLQHGPLPLAAEIHPYLCAARLPTEACLTVSVKQIHLDVDIAWTQDSIRVWQVTADTSIRAITNQISTWVASHVEVLTSMHALLLS